MNTHHHSMHGTQERQAPHGLHVIHAHPGSRSGAGYMQLLGRIHQHSPLDHGWMSDYRSTRLVPFNNGVMLAASLIVGVGVAVWFGLSASIVVPILAALPLVVLLISGMVLTAYRNRARHQARQMVIDSIQWRGDEQVLDVGCGSGVMINGCAQKLTTGRAVGIDMWEQEVGGTRDLLMANARAEGVANKVSLEHMDARQMTFDDARFNVIVSSFALHHIVTSRADMDKTISEMARVLASGGYLSLVDIGPMMDLAEPLIAHAGLKIVAYGDTSFFRYVTAVKS